MPEETNAGVGIIYPPPDMRGVIDKTAQFVAKCGPEFEGRVLREQSQQKFAFLMPNNPYRPYYEMKVKEFKTGEVTDSKPEVPQAIIDQRAKEAEKKAKKEQMKALTMGGAKKKVAKPPAPDQYVVSHPYIAPMDMDIIKLTAQFVARNGQKFLIGLTQRESRNPQFDFLKPTHALFGYFTSLVDAYTKCLMSSKEEEERLQKAIASSAGIMEKASSRFDWDEQEETTRVNKEEEQREEKEQMGQIDWHDFCIVEVIEFTAEDESMALAAPIDVSTMAPQGAPVPLDGTAAGTIASEARIEKPKGVEEEETQEAVKEKERLEKEQKEKAQAEQAEAEQKEREEKEAEEQRAREAELEAEEMEVEPDIPLPEQDLQMKVRKDYVRQRKGTSNRITQRCPITGQLIPAEDMSHHLKVLLLDPKWKHQKDALVERARKESAFADDVEANLASFVAKRPDLFGSVEEEIREAAEAGAEASAREAGADAGPAHTMVGSGLEPPKMGAIGGPAGPSSGGKSAPALAGAAHNVPAAPGALAALPGLQGASGPVAGMSTINARLPGTSTGSGVGLPGAGVQDDDDDEPNAKKPRLDDGSLVPEQQWVAKHPAPIQVLFQVNLGADGRAANIPVAIPMEVSVRMKVQDLKSMLLPKVAAAGVTLGNMKLKAQVGYILKDASTLAFYNLGPGTSIEISKKQRGGK